MKQDIASVMVSNPTWINSNASLNKAINLMNSTQVSHLLVRDGDRLVGVISKNDLLEKFFSIVQMSSGKIYNDKILENTKVSELIKRDPITLTAKDSVKHAIDLMLKNKIHCIPIINEENEPIGIMTPTDVMKAWEAD
ncbi:MAG: CBS domain-containing protein [Saprospiraceae bacterium]|nr:CBS domain-containing protein [Bacteroidia bacterium]NNE14699.1 CBS domain-containing protein [Saprospiraceae bacterium]NNL91013.1 CBS domain-containing protein [Saprospiraceae bacterium]